MNILNIEKRYNETVEHKTYADKQISKGIFDLVKLKKITRKKIMMLVNYMINKYMMQKHVKN